MYVYTYIYMYIHIYIWFSHINKCNFKIKMGWYKETSDSVAMKNSLKRSHRKWDLNIGKQNSCKTRGGGNITCWWNLKWTVPEANVFHE